MKRYLIVITVILLGMNNYGFCGELYKEGKEKLEKGIINLEMFKQAVSFAFQNKKIGKIRNCIKDIKDTERFSAFLALSGNSGYPYSTSINTYWITIGQVLNEAKEYFGTIAPESVNACLYKAIACVKMGDYQEALHPFKKVITAMTNGNCIIEPYWKIKIDEYKDSSFKKKYMYKQNYMIDAVQELFYEMADKVMNRELDMGGEKSYDEWAKMIINVFMDYRESWLQEKRQTQDIISKRLDNSFELVDFYIRHHKCNEAKKELGEVKKKLTGIGIDTTNTIPTKEKEIARLQEISVVMSEELVKEVNGKVKIRFWNDENWFKPEYLDLSFLPKGCYLNFKPDYSYECPDMGGTQTIYLNTQTTKPTCEIFSQSPIKVMVDGKSYPSKDGTVTISHFTGKEIEIIEATMNVIKLITYVETGIGIIWFFIK
ncbi:MAG: hypothetical protein AB1422_01435 [bacterium]